VFRKLNKPQLTHYFDSVNRENVHNILNSPINEEEILRVVKNLKSNKASGYDDIVNEDLLDQSLTFP
jgi:hypothetical protein